MKVGEKKGFKTGGRVKGVPNKATLELKAFTDALLAREDYLENVIARIMDGDADHIEKYLWEKRFGKAVQMVEMSGPGGGPVQYRWEV